MATFPFFSGTSRCRRERSVLFRMEKGKRSLRDALAGLLAERSVLALAQQLGAGLHDPRIVTATRLRLQLFDARRERERRALRTLRHHRLDRVGDSDDPRLEEDVVAAQAAWIAGPVHTLVVLADGFCHRPRKLDALQRFEPAIRVGLDQLELGGRELPGPPEDLTRYLQHAYVDELPHHPQAPDRVARQSHRRANASSELRDPARAPGLAPILSLGKRGERLDRPQHHTLHV